MKHYTLFTKQDKDALLLEFLIAYDTWCETDVNPGGFLSRKGLCRNIQDFQERCGIGCSITFDGHWMMWDHQASYFPLDSNGEPDDYPFGDPMVEPEDYRTNPLRRKWVRETITRLTA